MVDAVILWVDGDDPKWIEKRAPFFKRESSTLRHAQSSTRFAQKNEIYYCIKSIRKFAPFIDRIFLVTDDQTPNWLDDTVKERLGITMISHQYLFRNHTKYLPIFNSRSIETLLFEIDDLDEEFIFFNDDFFLTNPVDKSFFFAFGKPQLKGFIAPKIRKKKSRFVRNQKKLIWRFTPWGRMGIGEIGADRQTSNRRSCDVRLVHAPYPMIKSKMREAIRFLDPELKNIEYRFRHKNQYRSFTQAAQYLLDRNLAEINNDDWGYIDAQKQMPYVIGPRMKNSRKNKTKTLCIQSIDQGSPWVQNKIDKFLNELIE